MRVEYESYRLDVEGHGVHVWRGGAGVPVLLMHGAGPGTTAAGNFAKVRDALAERYEVYGTDMIGFGASDRKTEPPYFDYRLWLTQMQAVLDSLPDGPVRLIGHSISGSFAMRLAGRNARVERILLSCPMGTPVEPNRYLETLWSFPGDDDALRRSLSVLIDDDALITEELIASRREVLSEPGYDDYFARVFDGDKRDLIGPTVLSADELAAVTCPVSIIHGGNDLAFPQEQTAAVLARALPRVDLHVLARCSHGPAFERPGTFLGIALDFFG